MEVVYTELFEKWLKRLRDQQAKASILIRIERIEDENFGDYRSVGGGITELRIHVGQGYRRLLHNPSSQSGSPALWWG